MSIRDCTGIITLLSAFLWAILLGILIERKEKKDVIYIVSVNVMLNVAVTLTHFGII